MGSHVSPQSLERGRRSVRAVMLAVAEMYIKGVSTRQAETALAELVASDRDTAPKLATWLEENVPEGLAVFTLPEHHRRRLRTSNPMERAVPQELKRRTAKVRVFPSDDSLLRLVSAILVEIDEKSASDTKAYIKWECHDA